MPYQVKVFVGDHEAGKLTEDNGRIIGYANTPSDQPVIDTALEPYRAFLGDEKKPRLFRVEDGALAFLFNLRKHLNSGRGMNVSNVEEV